MSVEPAGKVGLGWRFAEPQAPSQDGSSVGTAADIDEFVADYYRHIDQQDLESYDPLTLRSRALKHYEIAQQRSSKLEKIEIDDGGTDAPETMVYIVTDDMPFLVDSLTAEMMKQGIAISLVTHPLFVVTRDLRNHEIVKVEKVPAYLGWSNGDSAVIPDLSTLIAGQGRRTSVESWIAIEITHVDQAARRQLLAGLEKILADVRAAVEDWQSMRHRALDAADGLGSVAGAETVGELGEAQELLRWMEGGHFTFLGYREYDLLHVEGEDVLSIRPGSGLGLLRDSDATGTMSLIRHLTPVGQRKARERRALVITKTNLRSTVHRPGYLDYIGIKSFDENGEVNGERRFIGLFSSSVYRSSVRDIPVVRRKVDQVVRHFGFPPDSHSGRDLVALLESYPRDEIFQIEARDLIATADGILRLQERRRTRLFLRPGNYGRFMSALVYLPRDRYTTAVHRRIEEELGRNLDAEGIDFEVQVSESPLARLFFRIRLRHNISPDSVDANELEDRVVKATRSWSEELREELFRSLEVNQARVLGHEWSEAFPLSYRVDFEVTTAVEDLRRFEEQGQQGHPGVTVYLPVSRSQAGSAPAKELTADARVKLYLLHPMSLSRILPIFHHLGLQVLDERPFEVATTSGREFFLYDLGLRYPKGVDPVATGELLSEAFHAAMTAASESDTFNRLVLTEGLSWRRVVILRSYAKYLRQMGNVNSYDFIADTLLAYPAIVQALIALFEGRFDPDLSETDRDAHVEQARKALTQGLGEVTTLDADRVFRTLIALIEATTRTNYFQDKSYLSIKLRPTNVDLVPAPRPHAEIWVYSPRVEGVHLRFGSIARGGLRWSDRKEDFRTEILGLVKAQAVKNAVIIPAGAKGGFYPKQLPETSDRQAWLAEGRESYSIFIRGLLDLTDNRITQHGKEQLVPPPRVVRHDGDDSYLVVAADKGTASFSDLANEISSEYNFWLGDAFASGGSVGYDHKAMGITARGAWESVKAHFSALGLDPQREDFTVVGIGDMSGDVFGNAMLLSEHIKLVAAFDHRHIFLDPNPDPAVAFEERRRLFELPRSSWNDYNREKISEGGGVYPRNAKAIALSPQMHQALGLPAGTLAMSPLKLLTAILAAPVDLFYNGGVGTYIKAHDESQAEVGDKSNDAVRVNGREVRARVVAEGGNLGLTQRGRIEVALQGTLLNTDAIDNSAGVDCSDHEVNIKIFIDQMVAKGAMEANERASFLAALTEDVARLVLADNTAQNTLLLMDRHHAVAWNASYGRLIDELEKTAGLDRALESIPSAEQLKVRLAQGKGLTSPELSVLAAYAKIALAHELQTGGIAEDPWHQATLRQYFPPQLVARFEAELNTHPLQQEIVATRVANDLINMGGITFAFRAMEETNANAVSIAKVFTAVREIFQIDALMTGFSQLSSPFPTEVWYAVLLDVRRLLDRSVRWLIHHSETTKTVGELVSTYGPVIERLLFRLSDYLTGVDRERVLLRHKQAQEWGLPSHLAALWSEIFESYSLLDIVRISENIAEPVEEIAQVYYLLFARFDIDRLLERVSALPRDNRWQALARAALRDDLYTTVADMTIATTEKTHRGLSPEERVSAWAELNWEALERARAMFDEAGRLEKDDMSSLSVLLRSLRSIVRR